MRPNDYSLFAGFVHLGAGIACGATGLAAGYAIGHIGDAVIIISFFNNVLYVKPLKPVCTSLCLRIQSVRINGSDPYLRRSSRVVRVSYLSLSGH